MAKEPYKKRLKYPHLGPEDTKIWNEFITNNTDFFKEVEYDVKVGEGRDYSDYPEDSIREDLEYLSKKRIDVVGFKDDEIWVIELKPKAGMPAIGQALSLAALYREESPIDKAVFPCVITDAEIPDVRALCKNLGILHLVCS